MGGVVAFGAARDRCRFREAYRPSQGTHGQQHRSGIMAPTSPRQRVLIICRCKCYRPDRIRCNLPDLADLAGPEGYRERVRDLSRTRPVGMRALRAAVPAIALVAAALSAPASAAAPASCVFDPMAATVTIEVGDGESIAIGRSGEAITLGGTACDSATVSNTNAITVNATGAPGTISIVLSGGPFAPGLSAEADGGDPEIEFTISVASGSPIVRVVGGDAADDIVAGSGGINLNASEPVDDADVTISGQAAIAMDGIGGGDALSVAGGAGTGGPAAANVNGGDGDDRLFGALGQSAFDGAAGEDTIDFAASASIDADLSGGIVVHAGGATDQISEVENVVGSPGDDRLIGTDEANVLSGEAGNDRVEGRGAGDTLAGGAGTDTVRFRSDEGVRVNLSEGTARGEGKDALTGFENVMGTKRADTIRGDVEGNKLAGGGGGDELFGHDGADMLTGGPGSDRLYGETGNDRLFGRAGRDELDGGDGEDACRGGPDPDSFVFCEHLTLG